jgi:hypothetical protein
MQIINIDEYQKSKQVLTIVSKLKIILKLSMTDINFRQAVNAILYTTIIKNLPVVK